MLKVFSCNENTHLKVLLEVSVEHHGEERPIEIGCYQLLLELVGELLKTGGKVPVQGGTIKEAEAGGGCM